MNKQNKLTLSLPWRWMISWAELCDGLFGVLTLGAWQPALAFRARMRAMERLVSRLEKESAVEEPEQEESYISHQAARSAEELADLERCGL